MKTISDLISSVTSVQSRYAAGRMERETVCEWVLGLGGYPVPYASLLTEASAWFRSTKNSEATDELKVHDLAFLDAIINAGKPAFLSKKAL